MKLVGEVPQVGDIDPMEALQLLPQKIAERKKFITSIALDLSVLREIGDEANPAEIDQLEKSLAAQKRFLALFEQRLDAVTKAANGVPLAAD